MVGRAVRFQRSGPICAKNDWTYKNRILLRIYSPERICANRICSRFRIAVRLRAGIVDVNLSLVFFPSSTVSGAKAIMAVKAPSTLDRQAIAKRPSKNPKPSERPCFTRFGGCPSLRHFRVQYEARDFTMVLGRLGALVSLTLHLIRENWKLALDAKPNRDWIKSGESQKLHV